MFIIVPGSIFAFFQILHYGKIGLRFAGILKGEPMVSPDIEVGKLTAYGPGCALFYCAGGNIHVLGSDSAKKIRDGGIDYLQITRQGVRNISEWKSCPPRYSGHFRYESNNHLCNTIPIVTGSGWLGDSDQFSQAMRNEPYYVGRGEGTQFRIIILPRSERIYVGWFD